MHVAYLNIVMVDPEPVPHLKKLSRGVDSKQEILEPVFVKRYAPNICLARR